MKRFEKWWEYEGRYYDWPVIIGVAVVVALLSAFVWWIVDGSKQESAEKARLMAQCMADGKKEYECVSILRKPQGSVIPIPIIIPSGR